MPGRTECAAEVDGQPLTSYDYRAVVKQAAVPTHERPGRTVHERLKRMTA